MIKCNKGKTKFNGSGPQLCTELAVITKNLVTALMENGLTRAEAVHLLGKATELGLKTEEEVHEDARKLVLERLKEVIDALEDEEEGEQADE